MGFVEAVRTCLIVKYATFEGRAARSEFWYFSLFYALMLLVFGGIGFALGGGSNFRAGNLRSFLPFVPLIIVVLAMIVPSIAVAVRRLDDRNMSGWWYLGFIALEFHSGAWQIGQPGNIGSLCTERHCGAKSLWP